MRHHVTITIICLLLCISIVSGLTLERQVSSSADDSEDDPAADNDLISGDLDLGNGGVVDVCTRFLNVTLPSNAILQNASLVWTVNGIDTNAVTMKIRGHLTPNSEPFITTVGNCTKRPRTGFVDWTPDAWDTIGVEKHTSNISSVISSIINVSGWESGNNLTLITNGTNQRDADAFDFSASGAPKLLIRYILPPDQFPEITLISPLNNSNITNDNTLYFNITVTDDLKVQNVTLFVNGVLNSTNTSMVNGSYSFQSSGLPLGNHNYSILAFDNFSQSTDTGNITFSFSLPAPPFVNYTPPPANNSRVNTNQSINFTCSSGNIFTYFNDSVVLENVTPALYNTSFVSVGFYNVSASCWDKGVQSQNTTITLEFDNINPLAIGVQDFTVPVNTTLNFSINFTDDHFFSYNLTCPEINYTDNVTGLDVTFYASNHSVFVNESTTCTLRYCDGHTRNERVKKWNTRVTDDELTFTVDGHTFKIEALNGDPAIQIFEESDRLRYSFTYPLPLLTYRFRLYTPNDAIYLPSGEFPGWIVDPTAEVWTDFKGAGDVVVSELSKSIYDVTVTSLSRSLTFESSGELNCVEESFIIEVEEMAILEAGVCPDVTTANILLLALLVGIVVGLYLINVFIIRMPWLNLLFGFALAGLGFTLWGCSVFVGAVMLLMGFVLMITSFTMQKS